MSNNLIYPPIGAYAIPEKNVLVLSCIDLRLTDNVLNFLHFDNLTNRYDHFTLAGASLLTQLEHPKLKPLFNTEALEPIKSHPHWKAVWEDHLAIAIQLHGIKDIYIIEHQDCGAYKNFLTKDALEADEKDCHALFATSLARELAARPELDVKVHCFYIDLRGNVFHLDSFPDKA